MEGITLYNGDPCHAKAPRGARTGTQGIKGAIKRGIIPHDLCTHIVEICEEKLIGYEYFRGDGSDER